MLKQELFYILKAKKIVEMPKDSSEFPHFAF